MFEASGIHVKKAPNETDADASVRLARAGLAEVDDRGSIAYGSPAMVIETRTLRGLIEVIDREKARADAFGKKDAMQVEIELTGDDLKKVEEVSARNDALSTALKEALAILADEIADNYMRSFRHGVEAACLSTGIATADRLRRSKAHYNASLAALRRAEKLSERFNALSASL